MALKREPATSRANQPGQSPDSLHRLNRALVAHLHSDQAMLRAEEEASFLDQICNIVAHDCGYAMVWVGFAESDPQQTVRPVAHAGVDEGYLDLAVITWADNERGRGPTGTAIRTGQPQMCGNMLNDPRVEPWRQNALKRGYSSSLVLPLVFPRKHEAAPSAGGPELPLGKVFGAMTIYSAEVEAFSADEIELLSALASDLSFGIGVIRVRAAHLQAGNETRALAAIVESADEAVIGKTLGGTITSWNGGAEQLYGYTRAEAIGRHISMLEPAEEFGETARLLQRLRTGETIAHLETLRKRKDGSPVPVSLKISTIRDASGAVVGASSFAHDISARREAEEALRKSQEQNELLADLIRSSSQPLGIGYPDGRLGLVNRAYEELTGYSAKELQSLDWAAALTPPEWREMEHRELTKLHQSGLPVRYEKEYIRKDGTRVPVEVFVHLVTGQAGKPLYYYSFLTDISARKAAEAERNRLAQQRRLALNAARLGWWHYDPIRKTSTWDDRYAEIFGFSGRQLPNEQVLARIHPDDLPGVWARVEAALDPNDPKPYSAEYRLKFPDSSIRWVEAHGLAEFTGEGADRHAYSFVGTVEDITERKLAERAALESKLRLELFIKSAPVALAMFDRHMRYLRVSDRWLQDTGVGASNILGKTHYEVFPDLPAHWKEAHRRGLAGEPSKAEENWIAADGAEHTIRWEIHPWGDSGDETGGIIISIEDITERKQAENVLHATLERFYAILSNMRAAVLLVTAEGQVEFANQAFCDFYELKETPDDLVGLSSGAMIEKIRNLYLHSEEAVARIQEIVERGEPVTGEAFAMKSGRTVIRDFLPLHVDGKVYGRLWVHTDITKSKQAEAALREREEQFRNLANAIPQLCWMANADGWIFWYNERWYDYTGTTPAQMAGWGWQTVHDPAMLPPVMERWKLSLAEGKPFDMVFPLRGGDGVFRPFLTRVVPIRDAGGKVTRWFGTNTDVTELREVQTALRDAEQRFRLALRNSPVTIAAQDRDLRYTWAYNHRTSTPEEIIGQLDFEIFKPEEARRLTEIKQRVLGEGIELREQMWLDRPGGRIFLDCYFEPLRNENGQVIGIGTATVDLTPVKLAEEKLRQSEEKFARAFANNPVAIALTRFEDGLFLEVNDTWLEMNGLTREETIGNFSRKMNIWPSFEAAERFLNELREKGMLRGWEQEFLKKSGEPYVAEISAQLMTVDGEQFILSTLVDVTERKLAEQALIRSEKLASVGRMAATISHEINNPLEAVTNVLFLARSASGLPEPVRQYLEMADAELKRIAHITRQSLGFYRESNAPVLASVSTVLESAVDLLKSRIRAKNANVDKELRSEVKFHCVAGELRQVFSNLLVNSLDAIDDGGIIKVRISTGWAFAGGRRSLRVTIADNGKGITPALQARIFEPFFTTKGAVGTGLGLWVSRQIVEKHGGKIRVRSRTGGARRGTVFTIVLPLEAGATVQGKSAGV